MVTDGRVARRQRNEHKVLDAVVALFDAGQMEPTVDEVSETSGVSTRSIYRYFHHREGLIDAALWRLVDRVEADLALRVGDGDLDDAELDERIRAFVEHRITVFGRIAPLVRATKRLARPVADVAPADAGSQRPLFALAPSAAFASDFERVDAGVREIAAISADAMFGFDTIDGLAHTVVSDTGTMAMILERHLRQQIAQD